MNLDDPRLQRVTSRTGREARNYIIKTAQDAGWIMSVHGRLADEPGTRIAHVQFRRRKGERPYPFSLNLNPDVPTFYVRRPTDRRSLLESFAGAHLNPGREVKIPVPDRTIAIQVAERFFASLS